ncbi:MAG: hypothetical protein WAW61_02405 [Methylococcaceae bacterium]
MTIEKATFRFYKITQCGYFARSEDMPSFGSIQETLEDLQNWSNGKRLIETKASEVEDSDTSGNTYLLDIQTKQGTWLITTWNEIASTDGGVASVQADSNVGNATVHMNGIVEGSIPGYATYFWIIPDRSIFASIRFHHPYTAQKPFRTYINKFMECYARHVVVGTATPESEYPILGYSNTPEDEPRHYYPRFKTELLKNPGEKQFLLDNINNITKVIRKEELDLSQGETLNLWQRLIRQARLSNPQTSSITPRITYEIPFAPTIDDIENMFSAWEEESESNWDDFGVKLRGSTDIHWVSHALARKEFELNIERLNDEIISAISIINAAIENRQSILALVST